MVSYNCVLGIDTAFLVGHHRRPRTALRPYSKRYAAELTSGTALDRFEFTLNLIVDGLGHRN
jgi:hypothetical protein